MRNAIPLFTAAMLAAAPITAHALVIVWNPGNLGVTLPGAANGDATVTVIERCGGTSTTLHSELGVDLVATGLALEAAPAGCTHEITVHDTVLVSGTNGSGAFEIAIAAGEFDVSDDDLPVALAYSVVSGTVATAPVLDLD